MHGIEKCYKCAQFLAKGTQTQPFWLTISCKSKPFCLIVFVFVDELCILLKNSCKNFCLHWKVRLKRKILRAARASHLTHLLPFIPFTYSHCVCYDWLTCAAQHLSKQMAAGHTYDNTARRLWSRTAGLETVRVCKCVYVSFSHSAGGELWISGADGLQFNWESAGLCRRATGMCIVKLYFSFVLTKCWCKGRGSEKPRDWKRGGGGARDEEEGAGLYNRLPYYFYCPSELPLS